MAEDLYFKELPLSMAAFELESIHMADASADRNGYLEVRSSTDWGWMRTCLRGGLHTLIS